VEFTVYAWLLGGFRRGRDVEPYGRGNWTGGFDSAVRGWDVRKAFVGNPQDIIEWVQTTRDEAAGALTWDSPHLGHGSYGQALPANRKSPNTREARL